MDKSEAKAAAPPASQQAEAKEKKEDSEKAPFCYLFRLASPLDVLLIVLGTVFSIGVGIFGPLIAVVFGDAIQGFSGDNTPDKVLDKVAWQSVMMIFFGLGSMGCSAISEACWTALGERLGIKVRCRYLEAVMKKEIPWFDRNHPQELPTKIATLVTKYQGGIGEKMGKVIISGSMFVCGLVVAFVYGWQLALVLLALSPLSASAARMISYANARKGEASKEAYATCGGYAEESLSAIRTVYAFCSEEFEKRKYLRELGKAQQSQVTNSLLVGAAIGCINLSMSLAHGFGYFAGSYFIEYNIFNYAYNEDYKCANVMTVLFSGIFAMFSLGMIAPQVKAIDDARGAAYDIYNVVDSVAKVIEDTTPENNQTIPDEEFVGRIEFKNVSFSYPTRPDVVVLQDFSIVFEPGTMVGICGETGSGKSTVIQLIERFYKPSEGTIEVDGRDINKLNLRWWRGKLGYVGQEPVLFNTSIERNIEYGKEGASAEDIKAAAQQANCLEFVQKLKDGFKTSAGAEGTQLSGGQKQRIAIARALLKRPKIMLLDEATSALDRQSEAQVQAEFAKLHRENKMLAIVIAHRLTTIKEADKIIVLQDGKLMEQGNDAELRVVNRIYANLCRLQEMKQAEGEDEPEVEVPPDGNAPRKLSGSRKGSVHETPEEAKRKTSVVVEKTEEQKKQEMAMMMALASRYSAELKKETWKHKLPLVVALILSLVSGCYMPMTGLLFGMVSMDLLEPDKKEMRRLVNLDVIGFCVLGAGMFFVTMGMFTLFGYVSAKVTQVLREKLYTHVMTMDIGWFDDPKHQPYAINTILAEGTDDVNGFVRMNIGTMVQAVSALVIALGLGFGFQWRMALLVLACVPVMAAAGFLNAKFHIGMAEQSKELYKASTGILTEAVKNFRTVASFCSEGRVLAMFSTALEEPRRKAMFTSLIAGLLFGIGQVLPFLVYAGVFYFAALFLREYQCDPRNTFIAVYSLVFAAMAIGQIGQYAPDMGKAYTSLFAVYGILDNQATIKSPEADQKVEKTIEGHIRFEHVSFKYPTRDEYVLQDLCMTINKGEKVAIVGISGSGKSTIIQLLERFYDPTSGTIYIDDVDIKKYSLATLRKSMGLVQQEPVLFDTTIEENIKYGAPEATMAEVRDCSRIADALDFIEKKGTSGKADDIVLEMKEQTPNQSPATTEGMGFKRRVGAKGSELSGGEKQRVAIARAILKHPKILLFDEATSALDSDTERQIQQALNRVSVDRTSIVIAHRLGTIGDQDKIFVLEKGKIVEEGTKVELQAKNGSFHKLYTSTVSKAVS